MLPLKDFIEVQEDYLSRYIKYKARSDEVEIEEAARRSLGRLFSQWENTQNAIVIITAFRNGRALDENRPINRDLAADIRQLRWGYTPVLGAWIETKSDENGQPQTETVHEELFFASGGNSAKLVKREIAALLKKYDQHAAVVKLPRLDHATLLFQNGEVTALGPWQYDPKIIAPYYALMRGASANRQFSFEVAGDESLSTRRIVDYYHRRDVARKTPT